jgi:hypothetical protein
MPIFRIAAVPLAIALLAGAASSVLACACCTGVAQRKVEVQKIDETIAAELAKVRFKKEAKLALGEAYDEAIVGLDDPSEDFTLEVARRKDRITFALRDEKGRAGTLSLLAPRSVSVFEVDPRDETGETGYGPRLYKEWKLTTAIVGDGIFRDSAGGKRRITLMLHGRGSACTTAEDFRHWTLLVHGAGTQSYTFYGELDTPQ